MVNYSNGKIYKIQPTCDHEEGEVYYGSTTKKYLSQRMDEHRSKYKLWKKQMYGHIRVFTLFEKYSVENCEIVFVELVNCNSKDELLAREKHHIKSNNCLNKVKNLLITADEKKQQKRQWSQDNREIVLAQKSLKCQCYCGTSYTHGHKSRHIKTKKHQNFINQQNK